MSQRARITRLASSDLLISTIDHYARWEIAGGIHFKLGYFDDDYVRFIGRIPTEALYVGNRERGLLRESMEGIVPNRIRYRMEKAGVGEAFEQTVVAMGGIAALGDLCTGRELHRLGVVDGRRFQKAIEEFAARPDLNPAAWSSFWRALSAEAFLRWFVEFTRQNADRP